MADILDRLRVEPLVADGAMGTMLHRAGIVSEQCHEQLNVTAPDVVIDIHRNYVLAGADCITTNTFGGSRPKLEVFGLGDRVAEFNSAAVRLARDAGAVHVLGDVGPSGLVLEPLGRARFDELFDHFSEQIGALASAGPDAILIETMTDIAEARCALLAALEVCDLPVFVTCTFATNGRTELSGTSPEAVAVILEACGAAAIGANCGLGPAETLPVVEALARATTLPLVVQPNAGMPRLEHGGTVFPGTPDEMGEHAARFVALGASIVGSCCGSTPAFTGAVTDFAKRAPRPARRERPSGLALASSRDVARIGPGLPAAVIGERINPTGRPELAKSLSAGSTSVAREYAVDQEREGANLLDVNVGSPGVEEAVVLPAVVLALSGLVKAPLVIDNTDPDAVEAALRVYPGRAMLNSVNGAQESMERLLPIARKYGAAVLILALDESGIPADAAGRLAVAQRVRSAAHAAGLSDGDLAVDCLVMTAATDAYAASVTLEAVEVVSRDWGLPTVLGVSNISHGLPGRADLNAAFHALALEEGLSAAIGNPAEIGRQSVSVAVELLLGRDPGAERWIAWATAAEQRGRTSSPEAAPADAAGRLAAAVTSGDAESAPALVDALVADGAAPGSVIGTVLTPAIQGLGDQFARGEVFLPQLIVAAEAMKAAVARVREYLPDTEGHSQGRVVFGTVKGDIHSIGKDICVSLLESAGYDVDDVGVDVAEDKFVEAAASADVVCLSALMTTTLPAMEATASAISAAGKQVVVGGAVVTPEFASSIGAGYADDAPGCVAAVTAARTKGTP